MPPILVPDQELDKNMIDWYEGDVKIWLSRTIRRSKSSLNYGKWNYIVAKARGLRRDLFSGIKTPISINPRTLKKIR